MPAPSLCFPSLLSSVSSHLWPLSQKIQSERYYQLIKINLWPICLQGNKLSRHCQWLQIEGIGKTNKKTSEIVSRFRQLTISMAINMGRLPLTLEKQLGFQIEW